MVPHLESRGQYRHQNLNKCQHKLNNKKYYSGHQEIKRAFKPGCLCPRVLRAFKKSAEKKL